jgi:hypothetical protein
MNQQDVLFQDSFPPLLEEEKKSLRRLKIQDRDLAILFFTWQCRYVAQRQYRFKFWPTSSQPTVSKRLSELKVAKLLKTHALPWLRDRLLYSVSTKGTRTLVDAGFTEIAVGDCPKPANDFTPGMKHDLDLVDLRIACERTGHITAWVSEHELRLARKQGRGPIRITDGMFGFQALVDDAEGLIEYERMGYRRRRFIDILNRLKCSAEHRAGKLIFFVCATPQRAETLRSWANSCRPWRLTPDLIFFSHYEAVKAGGLAGSFVNLYNEPLKLPKLID